MILESLPGNDSRMRRLLVLRSTIVDGILVCFLLVSAVAWFLLLRKHWKVILEFDDAHMFYRYAEHLRSGLGLSWNPDGVHTYGPTSMMWVAVVLLFSYLPLDDSRALLLASWLAGSLALLTIAWSVSLKTKSSYLAGIWRPLALIAVPLVALYAFHSNAVNGMDTMSGVAADALVAGCVLLWLDDPRMTMSLSLALAGLIAFLCRPDSGLPFLMIVCLGGLLVLRDRRFQRTTIVLGLYLFGVAMDLLLCRAYFGSALPFSFYVKSSHGYEGYTKLWYPADSLLAFLEVSAPFLAAIVLLTGRRTWRIVVTFLLPAMAGSVYYTFCVQQIMGHFGRYYVPLLPFVVVPGMLVLDNAIVHREIPAGRELLARAAVVTFVASIAPEASKLLDRRLASGRYAYELPVRTIDATTQLPDTNWFTTQVALADDVLRLVPKGASVAATEVGYLGSTLPQDTILDLSGLNDPHSVKREAMAEVVFQERPDVIWLPVPDYSYMYGSIYSNPELMRDYVVYDGAFNYGLAVRKDSPYRSQIDEGLKKAWASLYPGFNMQDYVVQGVKWDRRQYLLPNE